MSSAELQQNNIPRVTPFSTSFEESLFWLSFPLLTTRRKISLVSAVDKIGENYYWVSIGIRKIIFD